MRTPDVEAEITLQRTAQSGYNPQHKVRDDYLSSGTHNYIGCTEVLPGQTVMGTITFITPEAYPHCLWVGREIDIQEGSRVVGRARITRVLNPLLEKTS
jgi:hypothetical protein